MWALIFGGMFILSVLGVIYMVSRIRKFKFISRITQGKKSGVLLGILIVGIMEAVFVLALNVWNAMVMSMHILAFWLMCDGIGHFIKKKSKKEYKCYYAGIFAVLVSTVYLCVAWYFAHHVYDTNYQITAEKELGVDKFRVVAFTDSHVGANFHADKFREYVQRMNDLEPDIVVIVGDYVDDSTSLEDMVETSKALGELKTKYGVYYVFGNHDKGYYGRSHRGYGEKELVENLEKNGVVVLEDELVKLVGNISLLGRQDASVKNRKPMEELAKEYSDEDYIIVLDHQPNDFTNQTTAHADLVISGHTHGGQLMPLNYFSEITGMNDKTYGYEKRENTNFVVSSGISDWEVSFRTGCPAEIVIVDINGK